MRPSPSPDPPGAPSFRAAALFWLKLGFISFGGPAGQIAIMHREVVERRRWLDERLFLHALNFCMLLPGPEALQLAIYLGWRLHGTRGGLVAGFGFILPAIALLLALSYGYAAWGGVPVVAALLLGLKATVVALVIHALLKVAARAFADWSHWLVAVAAFVSMHWNLLPFPALLALAAIVGAMRSHSGATPAPGQGPRFAWGALGTGLALWAMPAALLWALAGPDSLYVRAYGFFTTAALVTFGGAYAVLAYVNQQVVEVYGWVSHAQTIAGLALAETTPGPLVIVLQFIGFMAGWNQPGVAGPAVTATVTALLASWATFLPSFVFILVGAPWIERISASPRLAGALAGITAAVVGVIGNLALVFGAAVIFPGGLHAPVWPAAVITAAALLLLQRSRADVLWIILGGAAAGLAFGMLS